MRPLRRGTVAGARLGLARCPLFFLVPNEKLYTLRNPNLAFKHRQLSARQPKYVHIGGLNCVIAPHAGSLTL